MKKLIILIAVAVLLFGFVAFLQFSGVGTSFIWKISDSGRWLLPLIGISALIDSINPCAFSILLLTIAFLLSIGKLRAKILQIGGSYILGIFLVYILIGLGILQTLHIFNTPHFMARVGASLLILLGAINLINEFFPAFPKNSAFRTSRIIRWLNLWKEDLCLPRLSWEVWWGSANFLAPGGRT